MMLEGDMFSLRDGGHPKNVLTYKMRNIFVPLLTLSHPKVIRLKTLRPAVEEHVHIYKFNQLSAICISMSSRLTLMYP